MRLGLTSLGEQPGSPGAGPENQSSAGLAKYFLGKLASPSGSSPSAEGTQAEDAQAALQDLRGDMSRLAAAHAKLDRQVRSAFERVKEEMGELQEGVDAEQDAQIEALRQAVIAVEAQAGAAAESSAQAAE